jgi:opacity protein-like surface antigen
MVLGSAVLGLSQEKSGLYIKADMGGQITENADLREFFGPVAGGSEVEFDAGFRAGFAGGYQLFNWLAGEIELGFMQSKVSSVTGATIVDDVWFGNFPVLFNGKVQLPNRTPFTPYAGAGVGFCQSYLDVDTLQIGGTTLHGDTSDTVFAWQAFAGLRFRINEQMGLSVEYRYFAADGATWEADFTTATASNVMKMGDVNTHAFSLAFDFRF